MGVFARIVFRAASSSFIFCGSPVVPGANLGGHHMRRRITKKLVDGLEPTAREFTVWDDHLPGFGVRVRSTGAMSYIVSYRAGSGRATPKKRFTIGAVGKLTPEQARVKAQATLGQLAQGRDPALERRKAQASTANTLQSIAENYFAREGHKLRSLHPRRRMLERLVYPVLGSRQIDEIRRSEIINLLDRIEDECGARTASLTLSYVGRIMNWHAARSDEFRSPIVRGMARGAPTKRDRVLTDEELRAFWRAADGWKHPFSRLLQFILFTAARREEAAGMRWDELQGSTWTIPAGRYKTKIDFELPLSDAALGVLATFPSLLLRRAECSDNTDKLTPKQGFVFTTAGETAIGGFGKFKTHFDKLMLDELRKAAKAGGDNPATVTLERWTIHDLRRTARSLMTRAGVSPDHAERALGHVIGGVRGVYDRHGYLEEKRRAFEALASQIALVLDPQPNVVPMRRAMITET
jgi:integrase